MKKRIAFAGIRHGHILSLYEHAAARPDVEIVAVGEDDPTAAGPLLAGIKKPIVPTAAVFAAGNTWDILAIGDVYGLRGSLAIQALRLGKQVILDKPICTLLEDLDSIEKLARSEGLQVGAQLDLRDSAFAQTARRLIQSGTLGRVHTVSFTAQHPLNFGKRPHWYFTPEHHGGTVHDIGIHGYDLLPWLLGSPVKQTDFARTWAGREAAPDFPAMAQVAFRLEDGTGVLGDLSYLSPESFGLTIPFYWKFLLHGEKGALEGGVQLPHLKFYPAAPGKGGQGEMQLIPLDAPRVGGYLEDFLAAVDGKARPGALGRESIFAATRAALAAQVQAQVR